MIGTEELLATDEPRNTRPTISEAVMNDFVKYLKDKKEFLEDGLGVFHTDNHSNW
jgi:hypothetical protein